MQRLLLVLKNVPGYRKIALQYIVGFSILAKKLNGRLTFLISETLPLVKGGYYFGKETKKRNLG